MDSEVSGIIWIHMRYRVLDIKACFCEIYFPMVFLRKEKNKKLFIVRRKDIFQVT